MIKYNKRVDGYLQPLKGDKIPKRFIFFDTETKVPLKTNDIRTFDLILGVAIFIELHNDLSIKQRVVHKFRTTQEFVEILQFHNRKSQMLHVFAHNIGFDIRVLNLPQVFNEIGFTSEPPIINQMAFIWRVKSDKGNYLFLDTANLGVRSVQSLGHDMGYEKKTIDFLTASIDELFDYCIVDVDILAKFVISYITYISVNELGSFKVTLASQAMTAFRTKFMHTQPYIHNYQPAIELERKAYHGGRVECFRLGKQPRKNWFYLDVNSMYPASMMGNDLPIAFLGMSYDSSIKILKARIKNYYIIADVLIDTDEPVYPYTPDDKLLFPIGKFRTILSHHELLYALEHNHIKKIYSSAQYKMGSLFEPYVNFFYSEKVKYKELNNKLWAMIAKLFLNALYGKWGQSAPHREPYGDTQYKGVYREPNYDVDEMLHFQVIAWYGKVYKEFKQGETSFSCPYIASAITAKARMLLWMYIKQAGRNNVAYVDTDSLIVNSRGFRRLLQNVSKDRLGALKLETQSQHFELWGNKDYVFAEDTKHKGIPTKAEKIGQNEWEYLEFEGMIRWLNRGAIGSPKGTFKVKHRKSVYNKGIINEDNSISPHTLDLGESLDIVVC